MGSSYLEQNFVIILYIKNLEVVVEQKDKSIGLVEVLESIVITETKILAVNSNLVATDEIIANDLFFLSNKHLRGIFIES